MTGAPWTPAEDALMDAALRECDSLDEAAARLSRETGRDVTKGVMRHRAQMRGIESPGVTLQRAKWQRESGQVARRDTPVAPMPAMAADVSGLDYDLHDTIGDGAPVLDTVAAANAATPTRRETAADRTSSDDAKERRVEHARFERLAAIAKRWTSRGESLTLEALCNELRVPPREARSLVEDAIEAGYALDVSGGSLDYRKPEPSRHYVPVAHDYAPGEERILGVASDWHVCSKHFERDAFCRHVDWLLEQGVRDIIAPGDLVAGGYRFLKYEVTHAGIEDQSHVAAELIASRWGNAPRWHAIAGNHCMSFDVGIDATRMIQRHMQERGFTNFHYYGARGGRLLLGDTRIEMWHPGGSLSYALTYKAQRHVDATAPDDRPHFLFVGHYHQEIVFRRGGVQVVLCGTFENGDSAFGRMIGGDVALGGWLIRYRMGADGRVAEMTPTFREYPQTKMEWRAA